jgi:hypothetical protein
MMGLIKPFEIFPERQPNQLCENLDIRKLKSESRYIFDNDLSDIHIDTFKFLNSYDDNFYYFDKNSVYICKIADIGSSRQILKMFF